MPAVPLFASLVCPLDGTTLSLQAHSWRCEQGHAFDVAAQGYVNLLPVQHKRTLEPGDSKEMVAARSRFLAHGYYRPIATRVAQIVSTAAGDSTLACLDAGCGEGYYVRQCDAYARDQKIAWVGLDISKWAVMAAAKQARHMRWLVGSNANLPIAAHTIDHVLCMFGFPVYAEFARVLKPGAGLLLVEAGARHLHELREIIYPEIKDKKPTESGPIDGFKFLRGESLSYQIELTEPGHIADLLLMTPHLFRASVVGRERAARLDHLSLTVDVSFNHWQRHA